MIEGVGAALLEVDGLATWFTTFRGTVKAVDGVSITLAAGRTLGVVGESGSGKSVMALSIMRLIDAPGRIVSGRVLLDGVDLLALPEERMRQMRGGDVAMVFQEPMTSLNPVLSVGRQIGEAVRLHATIGKVETQERVLEMLEAVGIPDPPRRARQYPHELSGGMRQRVMIAMALATRPRLLIADEPTTALDVTIQAQILELLAALQARHDMAVLLITHDLGVVAEVADDVAVMYAGRVVESGTVFDVFDRPGHPYTRSLLASLPRTDDRRRLDTIEGTAPDPVDLPPGCPFAPRCPVVVSTCREADPPLVTVAPGHRSRCWLAMPVAPETNARSPFVDAATGPEPSGGREGDA